MNRCVLAACLLAAAPGLARAARVHYHADLKGSLEVPATGSAGTGALDATLDTVSLKLDYTLSWSGLTGPATMAHFHGPAPAGKNAGVVVVIGGADPVSPVHATAQLTPPAVQQLDGGLMYVNVHTAKFPKGEIRGQVMRQ